MVQLETGGTGVTHSLLSKLFIRFKKFLLVKKLLGLDTKRLNARHSVQNSLYLYHNGVNGCSYI